MYGHGDKWWRSDGLLPALLIVGPYFLNKLIYIEFPGYLIFVAVDYSCRIFTLLILYLLLRSEPAALPVPWRLSLPSMKELMIALIAACTLIGAIRVGQSFIRYLNAHSWRTTGYPLPTSSALHYFDDTVGMVFVGLSEEVIFRFYLVNLLLLRGMRPATAIVLSTLIFAGIHWSHGAGTIVFATFAGLILSILFLHSRNLIVPVLAHATYDAVLFA